MGKRGSTNKMPEKAIQTISNMKKKRQEKIRGFTKKKTNQVEN